MQTPDDSTLKPASQSASAQIAQSLESVGLNLFAVQSAAQVNDPAVPPEALSLLLVGAFGRKMWDCIPADYYSREHPVDDFSIASVSRIMMDVVGAEGWEIIFPDRAFPVAPSLQTLGRIAGWHNPSPLGNGIHPKHGLWFAYRAVVAVNFTLEQDTNDDLTEGLDSPCVSCVDTPCIKSCPAGALKMGCAPDLTACVTYRSSADSPCANRCIAREQCPVGVTSRYTDDQIRYFYGRSLLSLQQWVAAADGRC